MTSSEALRRSKQVRGLKKATSKSVVVAAKHRRPAYMVHYKVGKVSLHWRHFPYAMNETPIIVVTG